MFKETKMNFQKIWCQIWQEPKQTQIHTNSQTYVYGRFLRICVFLFTLTNMGCLCDKGHKLFCLCDNKNEGATRHLWTDVLLTQRAKWTAKRVCRGLFGQYIVDFSKKELLQYSTAKICEGHCFSSSSTEGKQTPRDLRKFAKARVLTENCQRPDFGCVKPGDNNTV